MRGFTGNKKKFPALGPCFVVVLNSSARASGTGYSTARTEKGLSMIKKRMVRSLVIAVAVAFTLLAGCDASSDTEDASSNPLIGSWAYVQTADASLAAGTYTYRFGATDYALVYTAPEELYTLEYAVGSYTYDNTTITMTATKRLGIAVKSPLPLTSSYEINGSVLTLTDEDYGSTEYRKQ